MLAAIDSLGLAFAVYLLGAVVLAVVVGRVCGLNDRLSREQHAEQTETDGSLISLAEYVAEREAQDARARFRHATRYGRSA